MRKFAILKNFVQPLHCFALFIVLLRSFALFFLLLRFDECETTRIFAKWLFLFFHKRKGMKSIHAKRIDD